MSQDTTPLTRHLLFVCTVAALGGLLLGFDTAVIAGVTGSLTRTFHLTPISLGVTVSGALWGTVIGAVFAGRAADAYGRRASLMALGLIYVATAVGCALAWNWSALLAFRVLGGLAIGASSVISPTYIAEVAPARFRGRLSSQHRHRHPGRLCLELPRGDHASPGGLALEVRSFRPARPAVLRCPLHYPGESTLAGASR